jgi:hypothetical protein
MVISNHLTRNILEVTHQCELRNQYKERQFIHLMAKPTSRATTRVASANALKLHFHYKAPFPLYNSRLGEPRSCAKAGFATIFIRAFFVDKSISC